MTVRNAESENNQRFALFYSHASLQGALLQVFEPAGKIVSGRLPTVFDARICAQQKRL